MPAPRELTISLASNSCGARQSGRALFLLAPQPLGLQSCGSGHHGMSLIFGTPSKRSSTLRQLISAKWAQAPSRVPHLLRRPGSLRRHRSLELRGPVAGRY